MRTLNTINSSFDSSSRPASPAALASNPSANKLVASSKTLSKTRSGTPTVDGRPRYPSAGATISSSRSPSLGFHDSNHQHQHVLAVTATITSTRSTSSSSAPPTSSYKMAPSDSRHRPPQLSAAAAKTVGRTPLTPKIASTAKGPAIGAPPPARRSTQNLAAGPAYRDDNVKTPRSGSRQSRPNSNSTTPSSTPNLDRNGWDPRASLGSTGRRSLSRAESPADFDSKFFRASDALATTQASSRPSLGSQKSNNFFHASGVNSESKRASNTPTSAPNTNAAPESSTSKFFYANGIDLELKPGPQAPEPPSANSSSSRLQTGRPSTGSSGSGHSSLTHGHPPRPHSPIKIAQPAPSILRNTGTPGLSARQQIAPPPLTSPSTLAPAATINSKRRVSIESPPKRPRGHARTGSVPNFDHSQSPRLPMSPSRLHSEFVSPPVSPGSTQPALTMASILQMAEDIPDEEDTKEDESQPEVQSPTKSSHGDSVNEHVANARRERKVQDLEIRNASLEAINRTIERQLRKQKAELRRYRRLSRSGHLSAAASAASSRVPSAALTDIPISLSDLGEENDSAPPSEDEGNDSIDESDNSMTDSAEASDYLDPNDEKAIERAENRRRRDERRLQLDLSKHRELLVDSQKINQSIKRCLNWTEVLIKEGQKALEYKVHISEVDFGGHVLPPPIEGEDEDDDEEEDDTLSHVDDFDDDTGSVGSDAPLPWEKSSQDRDSGIELQPDSN
ncbi:hypothetical protein F66182_6722 [Fusarium sp. NRRL 66182]|nr:hypothetical protein F66182_6722 [Fusarium sp. NRRL 66182]